MHPSRVAGVTIPLFSIRTERDWGIGQITDLPACAAWIARAGHKLLQLLPPYELAGGETSPYGARTAFGLDPTYIDVGAVEDLDRASIDDALGAEGQRALARARARRGVDYGVVRELKGRVLRRAFERFHAREWLHDTARARALSAFMGEQRLWADDLALYVALRDRHAGHGWESWPGGERMREQAAIDGARRELELRVVEHHYGQWVAHSQWDKARAEVRALGVELMGDLPFIVCRESADVWARAWDFRLDVSLGAPPDAYSEDGQDWGLPAYNWAAMDREDLTWLRARTRHAAKLYDRFRLDHVVGYFRMYVKKPGQHGTFDPEGEDAQRSRGERVLRTMLYEAGDARVIGEDLGVVPPFVRATLGELGVPGYRVIPWEKDDGAGFRDPARYPASSVATWSTHDTPPIVAWWDELPDSDREALAHMAGIPPKSNDAGDDPARSLSLLRTLFASSSELTLVLAAELLGERERINTPGTVGGANWTYRLPRTIEALERDPTVTKRMESIGEMARSSGR
jgi:4-alpha-glucanotransferase